MSEEYLHPEKAISQALGVQRSVLKGLRKDGRLLEDEHWSYVDRKVCYSRAGLIRMMEVLGLDGQKNGVLSVRDVADRTAEQAAENGQEYTARVTRHFHVRGRGLNRKIMAAEVDGEPVRVRVRNTAMFVRGMEIPVRKIDVGLYEFAGRMPKRKGRLRT